jgi:hypothetical protein
MRSLTVFFPAIATRLAAPPTLDCLWPLLTQKLFTKGLLVVRDAGRSTEGVQAVHMANRPKRTRDLMVAKIRSDKKRKRSFPRKKNSKKRKKELKTNNFLQSRDSDSEPQGGHKLIEQTIEGSPCVVERDRELEQS